MALYIREGGAHKAMGALYTKNGGAVQGFASVYTKENGALCPLFADGTMLSDMSIGDTVTLREGEKNATYRIWHKGYLDTQAVLLVREEVLPVQMAFADTVTDYGESAVDAYLQTEFLPTLDGDLRARLVTVDVPFTRHGASVDDPVITASRSCFLLSVDELGGDIIANGPSQSDGTRLDYHIAQAKACGSYSAPRVAYDENGIARPWWLRSALSMSGSVTEYGCFCTADGALDYTAIDQIYYLRPALAVHGRYIPT